MPNEYVMDLGKALINQETREAVFKPKLKEKITRCKDCIHNVGNWNHDELDDTDYTDITCDYFMTDGMEPNDFCSYGKSIQKMEGGTK